MTTHEDRLSVSAWPAFANRTGNPYNRLLYAPMASQGVEVEEFSIAAFVRHRYDVWHLHWPEGLARPGRDFRARIGRATLRALLRLARRRGTRIVWTAHNLTAHDHPDGGEDRDFWSRFIGRVDGVVSLSEAARLQLLAAYPRLSDASIRVIPHGHYRDVIGAVPDRAEARRVLGLDEAGPVVVHLGAIRPYKNVPTLIRAFRQRSDPDAQLVVAGAVSDGTLESEARRAAEGDARIHLWLDYQPDERLALVAAASDVVILPYRSILNSGSALYALSCDRPVVVPALGSMLELQAQVGAEWVYTYEGTFTPAVLGDALAWAQHTRRSEQAPLDHLAWDRIAAQTVAFYRARCNVPPGS